MKIKTIGLLLLVIFFRVDFISAQGALNFTNINASFPRITCQPNSLTSIRNKLLNEPQKTVYAQIYAAALSPISQGNTTDNDRRNRATTCKNAAFSFLIAKKISGNFIIGPPQSETDTILKNALFLLNTMNTFVDSISMTNLNAADAWQWRSNEIIDYAMGYDCLKGANINDSLLASARNKLQQFAGNLFRECNRSLFGNCFWSVYKNNTALLMCGALGTAAIVLSDAVSTDINYQPQAWLNCALVNTDSLLWFDDNRKSIKGKMAGYSESPYYFLYALQHLSPFFIGLNRFVNDDFIPTNYQGRQKNIKQPLRDADYDKLFDWLFLIRMPDGRLPAVDDTYMDVFNSSLMLCGKPKYYLQNYYSGMSKYQCNNFLNSFSGADDYKVNFLGLNFASPNTLFNEPPSQILADAGNIVFRSGWDSAANYMHLTSESGIPRITAGGHNQADEMSFIIESKGQLLAFDPGYIQYDQRSKVCEASNHNMVLVDGQGTACGTPGSSGGADVIITDTFISSDFNFVEMHTNYNNADIRRCAMMIDNKYFALWDFGNSTTPRNFTWQLHGYGQENGNDSLGYFTDSTKNGFARWRKNNITLQSDIVARDASINFRKATNIHELSYLKTESHTTLLGDIQNTNHFSTGSILYPFDTLKSSITHSKNLLLVDDGKSKSFFTLGNETESHLLGNAESAFCRYTNDSLQTLFAYNTTYVKSYDMDSGIYNEKSVHVRTLDACNLFLNKPLTSEVTIHISNANTVFYAPHYTPITVVGNNVVSWQLLKETNILKIVTSGAGMISIHSSSIPNTVNGIQEENAAIPEILLYPNPAKNILKVNSPFVINQISIITLEGKEIFNSQQTEIDITNLQAGTYLVAIKLADQRIYYRRLIKT